MVKAYSIIKILRKISDVSLNVSKIINTITGAAQGFKNNGAKYFQTRAMVAKK